MLEQTIHKPWQTDGRNSVKNDVSTRIKGLTSSKFFGFMRSFSLPVILTPELFGLWSLITVFINYTNLTHLGILFEMNRRLPQLEVKDKVKEYIETRSIAFWFGIFMSIIVGLLLLLFYFSSDSYGSVYPISFILLIIPIIFLQHILNYQKINMRALGKIRLLSNQEVLFSFLLLVLNVFGGYFFKINGMLISTVIAYSIVIWYFRKHNIIDSIVLNIKKTLNMLKLAIPLLIVGLLSVIMGSIGQIFVANKLNLISVSYLSLGVLIGSIVYTIPTALAGVLNPRYLREYGKSSDPKNISIIFMKYLRIMSIITPVFIGIIMITFDFVINSFLNKYEPAIEIIQILLIGMSFQSLSLIFGDPLITINKQSQIIYAQLFSILLLTIGISLVLEYGYNLKGVALVIILINIMYSFILASLFIIYTSNSKYNWFELLKSILNTILILFISIFITYFLPLNHISIWMDFLDILYRLLWFLILISALVYKIWPSKKKDYIK